MQSIQTTIQLPKTLLLNTKIRKGELNSFVRRTLAIELYREGKLSLGKATELAGFETRWEMLMLLAEKKVPLDYTLEDAEDDLKTLKKVLRK